jgi:outer membrane protein assembly factor BamD
LIAACAALLAAPACSRGFKIAGLSGETLFAAGMQQYRARKWDRAIQAFERLTLELAARDTLLPLAHFYLGKSHAGKGEHLLAAQSYNRMAESFATDTLADDAMYESAREYQKMWRKPELDPQYGEQSLTAYQTLLALYPDTDLKPLVDRQVGTLNEWFATKDYSTGMHYFRRKAWDSALIYFKDVVARYPQTARARDAYIALARSYDAIQYREDKNEVCATLHDRYPTDREVSLVCGAPTIASRRDSLQSDSVRRAAAKRDSVKRDTLSQDPL